MIGRTNSGTGGGGGLSPNNAVIHVIAPIGSTIAFEKGGVTVKVLDASKSHVNAADSTMADWYFSVSSNNYGVWTVTATLNENTISDNITVDNNKEYDLRLRYGYYLFRSGHGSLVQYNKFANGVNVGTDFIEITSATGGASYWQTKNAINLTPYKSFKVDAEITWIGTDSAWYGRAAVRSGLPSKQPEKPTNNLVASTIFSVSARKTYSVSITNLASGYYLGYAGNTRGKIYNMWLEY